MEIKRKRSKDDTYTKPFTVPVSEHLKTDLEKVKRIGIDVNGMTREFWKVLIEQSDSHDFDQAMEA